MTVLAEVRVGDTVSIPYLDLTRKDEIKEYLQQIYGDSMQIAYLFPPTEIAEKILKERGMQGCFVLLIDKINTCPSWPKVEGERSYKNVQGLYFYSKPQEKQSKIMKHFQNKLLTVLSHEIAQHEIVFSYSSGVLSIELPVYMKDGESTVIDESIHVEL